MLSIIDKLPDGWEAQLESRLLCQKRDRLAKRAYICSPCSAGSQQAVHQNIRAARYYMHYALNEMCVTAVAPHAYLPVLLSDANPQERALALRFGLWVLETCDFVFACGNRVSNGMREEIEHAAKLGIPIQVFHSDMYPDVRKIATRAGADKGLVTYEDRHPLLSRCADELFQNENREELRSYARTEGLL